MIDRNWPTASRLLRQENKVLLGFVEAQQQDAG